MVTLSSINLDTNQKNRLTAKSCKVKNITKLEINVERDKVIMNIFEYKYFFKNYITFTK